MKLSKIFSWLSVFCFVLMVGGFLVTAILGEIGFLGRPNRANPLFLLSVLGISASFIGGVGFLFAGLIFRFFERRRVLKLGKIAEAEILSLRETGTRINRNPVVEFSLRVSPADYSPFVAKARKTISLIDLMSYQPGNIVIVKFLPQSRETEIVALKRR